MCQGLDKEFVPSVQKMENGMEDCLSRICTHIAIVVWGKFFFVILCS